MSNPFFRKRTFRLAFRISLTIKGIFALLEIFAGITAHFVSHLLLSANLAITREELTEDPGDVVVRYLLQTAHSFSLDTQKFASMYLLSHGIIKALLIAGLLRQKLWYYPAAIIVFVSFILYQLHRFTHALPSGSC